MAQPWARATSNGFGFETNTTSAWDNELKFAAAESARTSIIVLACFNTIAGFVTAAGILGQSWVTARRIDRRWSFRSSWSQLISPADVFPFVLSWGIAAQGIVFSISQSKGLKSLTILGCTGISQAMLPAFLLLPIIQVVFGLELAIRALKRRRPFPARGRWNTVICLAGVVLCVMVALTITMMMRPPNFCFACLVWYLQPYQLGCFIFLIVVVALLAVEVTIVFFRLVNATNLGPMERIEASRMVYFLIVAIVSNVSNLACNFLLHIPMLTITKTIPIPFFFYISFGNANDRNAMNASMVAAVVINLSGLLTGSMHLLLRSNRTATIGPNDWDGIEPKAFEKGFSDGGSSFDFGLQITQPISPPKRHRRTTKGSDGASPDTLDILRGFDASRNGSLHVPSLGIICPPVHLNLPSSPEPARVRRKSTLRSLKKSWYNMMPNPSDAPLLPKNSYILPTSRYAPPPPKEDFASRSTENLLAPPQIREQGDLHHHRGSSIVSSATVQIGLRLSNVGDMPPATATLPEENPKVHDVLEYPIMPLVTSKKPSPLGITVITLPDEEAMKEDQRKNKDLPPVPARSRAREQIKEDAELTLSPDVYSPTQSRAQHSRAGSRSSYKPRRPSVSSRASHSRQGSRSRTGPEPIREDWI
ncbi:hypothetical protein BGZ63DRAFT_404064 [Mariannaea sp. PMI_226]|nr:hypothetical protein BGZ63DRAFT_404064 [Mariannaea sp. PMI_226]